MTLRLWRTDVDRYSELAFLSRIEEVTATYDRHFAMHGFHFVVHIICNYTHVSASSGRMSEAICLCRLILAGARSSFLGLSWQHQTLSSVLSSQSSNINVDHKWLNLLISLTIQVYNHLLTVQSTSQWHPQPPPQQHPQQPVAAPASTNFLLRMQLAASQTSKTTNLSLMTARSLPVPDHTTTIVLYGLML